MKISNMLLIGATEKHSGKTELSTNIIKKFHAENDIIGIKATISREGEGKKGFSITEEKNRTREKDTSRMLTAGAKRVFWIKSDEESVMDALNNTLEQIPKDVFIVCESNSLRKYIEPAIFLMVSRDQSGEYKKTALQVINYADIIIRSFEESGIIKFKPNIENFLTVSKDKWILKFGDLKYE